MRIHHNTAKKAKSFGITLVIEDNEVVASKNGTRLASGLQGNKVLEDAITKATGKPGKVATTRKIKDIPTATGLTLVSTEETDTHVVQNWIILTDGDTFAYTTRTEIGDTECTGRGLDKQFKLPDGSATTAREIIGQAISGEIELTDDGETVELGADEADEQDEDDSDADQGRSIVKSKYKERYKPTKDKCGDELSFEINEFVTVEDDAGEKKVSKKLLRAFAEANGCWVPAYGSLVSRTGGWNAGMARMNVANRLRAKIRQAAKAETEFKVVWPKV